MSTGDPDEGRGTDWDVHSRTRRVSAASGPDEFMFSQFRRHSTILRTPRRHSYFMLSGGANLFPMSEVLKEILCTEVRTNLSYGWYTSDRGFPTLQQGVSLWENFAASEGEWPIRRPLGREVCLTIGASQAVASTFDYVARRRVGSKVLLVGLNYGLFDRLARHNGLEVVELIDDGATGSRTLPDVAQVVLEITSRRPALTVLTVPNNPAGELYSPDDLASVMLACHEAGTLLLLDQVGQLPMQAGWTNVGRLIAATETQSSSIIINSFSKSDSIPGFRLGYLIGPRELIEHAASLQHNSIMNPQTAPIVAPFFALVARCVFAAETLGWSQKVGRPRITTLARRLLGVTTAIPPDTFLEWMLDRFDPRTFEADYLRYLAHHKTGSDTIRSNRAYLLDRLAAHISRATQLEGGFNCLVEFSAFEGRDEDEVCKWLFEASGLAILTESCFRVTQRTRKNFWVRMSLAADGERFHAAIDQLAGLLGRFR